MTVLDWVLSTFSSAGLIAALAWLFRSAIETRLRASVQHESERVNEFGTLAVGI